MSMKLGALVVFASDDGESGWTPVLPHDVPRWISADPECLGRLVAGEIAQGPGETRWFTAKRTETITPAANEEQALSVEERILAIRSTPPLKLRQPLIILPDGVKP